MLHTVHMRSKHHTKTL